MESQKSKMEKHFGRKQVCHWCANFWSNGDPRAGPDAAFHVLGMCVLLLGPMGPSHLSSLLGEEMISI